MTFVSTCFNRKKINGIKILWLTTGGCRSRAPTELPTPNVPFIGTRSDVMTHSKDLAARRRILAGLAATGGAFLIGRPAAAADILVPTPAATEGPFYPDRLPLDDDADLLHVDGNSARAAGTPFDLAGTVRRQDGSVVEGARLEIWQCDANGVYLHSGDSGRRPFDTAFQGFGRTSSGADGAWRFRTIVPVPYTGRTPHIHFKVIAPNGRAFVTQMYIEGHPQNDRDFLFRWLRSDAARRAASVRLSAGIVDGTDGVRGAFEIVLT
jgi:protocatechuate 3,4-dioxygenase beta subunit